MGSNVNKILEYLRGGKSREWNLPLKFDEKLYFFFLFDYYVFHLNVNSA